MANSERPSPFTVLSCLPPNWTTTKTREKWTIKQLITFLVEFADCFEANEKRLANTSSPLSWPHQAAMNASITSSYQETIRQVDGIDRVREYVLKNYGEDLTIGTARRLVGELMKNSGLKLAEAESLLLEAAMDKLDSAESQSRKAAEQKASRSGSKRSTNRGDGRKKLIAALTEYHQYDNGSCLQYEPIGNNELAGKAKVSPSTASAFFRDEFKGYAKYRAACKEQKVLNATMKLLNKEFCPYHLLSPEVAKNLPAPEADDHADSEN